MLTLSDKTRESIRGAAEAKGCRLLAIESGGAGRFTTVRVVLERANGEPVTVEECEAVSREVSALLDASDEIRHRYTLEVSSAGLDRKIYSLEEAARFVGRRVKVRTENPVEPDPPSSERGTAAPARNIQGVLSAVQGDRLTVVDEENRKTYNVRFADIRLARLQFDWPNRA